MSNVSYTGNPEAWPEDFSVPYPKALHKFAGEFMTILHPNGFLYIMIPAYSRGYRRTYLAGVPAMVVIGIAKSLGKPLAVENLDFGKGRMDTNKRFNRMASNFPYQKILDAVARRAVKEGIGLKSVWSASTSTIAMEVYEQIRHFGASCHGAGDRTAGHGFPGDYHQGVKREGGGSQKEPCSKGLLPA